MAELRQICQRQIMDELFEAINGRPEDLGLGEGQPAYKVLVLDDLATRIISSCCKMSDITYAGVSHVESLAKRRQPLPMLEAIYFVAPTQASVDAICRDFPGKKSQYKMAHIVFTSHLSDALLQQISQNRSLCGQIAALKELNMEFLAVEDQVFSLEVKSAFHSLYADPPPPERDATQRKVAQRLASLCITLGGELPLVRYDAASSPAAAIALDLDGELRRFHADEERSRKVLQANAKRHGTGARPTVLVLDRARDIATPLLHELTYQAMAQDLLEVSESGVVTRDAPSAGGQAKAGVLSDDDLLWAKYKHEHIAETLGGLEADIAEFREGSKHVEAFRKSQADGAAADTKAMTKVVKDMPRFMKQNDKLSMHTDLSQRLFKLYEESALEKVCGLEMEMLFGEDATGSSVLGRGVIQTAATLPEHFVDTLRQAKSADDQARLLALLQLTQPELAQQLREDGDTKASMRYPREHEAVEATVERLSSAQSAARGAGAGAAPYSARGWRTDKDDYPGYSKGSPTKIDVTSRYKPALYWQGRDMINQKLDLGAFPYAGEEPRTDPAPFVQGASHRSQPLQKKSKSWKGGGARAGQPGPRLILFVVGGISYSECRTAYELSRKFGVTVFVGSTEVLTPQRALQRLSCAPPAQGEEGDCDRGEADGAGTEASALDEFLEKIPFEKIFPCCFRTEVRRAGARPPLSLRSHRVCPCRPLARRCCGGLRAATRRQRTGRSSCPNPSRNVAAVISFVYDVLATNVLACRLTSHASSATSASKRSVLASP